MLTFSYDLETDIGKVRLLIADTDISAHDFTDAEVDVALTQESDSIKRAAALLLLALASNRARLAVSVKRGAVSEDLSKLAAELRAQAEEFVKQAAEAEDLPLEAVITPSYERFSYTVNLALDRDDADGDTEVLEAP